MIASDRPYGDPGPVMFETWAQPDQVFLILGLTFIQFLPLFGQFFFFCLAFREFLGEFLLNLFATAREELAFFLQRFFTKRQFGITVFDR